VSELLTIDEALELVLARVERLEAEDVPLAQAAGRVLAEPAAAAVDLPPFAASAMDGFAVRAEDAPATLPVVGRVAAGRPADRALAPAEAMAIATGGVVPAGADTVVPIEDVEQRDGLVVVPHALRVGANVRERGGDLAAGDIVIEPGVRLGPVHLGALAAAGVTTLRCTRAPRAVLAVTGSELRAPGEALEPGQIYDANGLIIETQIRSTGACVERLAPVVDDPEQTRAALARGLDADVLVTSGGVSVGTLDLVRATEAELGVDEVFWQVAVRPGKPVAFGVRGRTLVFGLPGNPVSSLVSSVLFVLPALRALQGDRDPAPRYARGVLAGAIRPDRRRDELVRARLTPEGDLEPLSGQESHMIVRAAVANALVFVPTGTDELPVGSVVRYLAL
jgi:molybdopterin molybdotransferase